MRWNHSSAKRASEVVDGGRIFLRIEAVEEGRARVRFPADADPLAFLLVVLALVAMANGISARVAWRREAFLRRCSPVVDPGRLAAFLDALRASLGRDAPTEPELVRARSGDLEEVILTSTWQGSPLRFHLLISGGRVRGG